MTKIVLVSIEYMKKTSPTPLINETLWTLLNVLLLFVLESQFFIALKQLLKKLK